MYSKCPRLAVTLERQEAGERERNREGERDEGDDLQRRQDGDEPPFRVEQNERDDAFERHEPVGTLPARADDRIAPSQSEKAERRDEENQNCHEFDFRTFVVTRRRHIVAARTAPRHRENGPGEYGHAHNRTRRREVDAGALQRNGRSSQ